VGEKGNKTIGQLSRWAIDPDRMARFTQVALLCQRTKFVKKVMCMDDHEDSVVRLQVKAVCDAHAIACVVPRGVPYCEIHCKSLTPLQRLHVTYLLNLLLGTDSSGLSLKDGIVADQMLDRMIVTYRKYLALFLLEPSTADVPFELFYFIYERYTRGELDMVMCDNCGSAFVNLRFHQSLQCPICNRFKLAKATQSRRFNESDGLFTDLVAGGSQAMAAA
jgi:hypothetical protein